MSALRRCAAAVSGCLLLGAVQLALVTVLTLEAPPATASLTRLCLGYTGCANAGMSSSGYASANGSMYWRMYSGHNCTNYVAYRMVHGGMPNTRPWTGSGNATNWGVANADITNQTPTVGAVAWWRANVPPAGSVGHVAYVEQVISSTEIVVSMDSWGGDFSWNRITKVGGDWPSGFVHFKDPGLTSTARPVISGTAAVGSTLTATVGSWSATPTGTSFQWYADGVAIRRATSARLVLDVSLLGKRLGVRVTATSKGQPSVTARAKKTAAVAPGAITSTTRPAVTGTAAVGSSLSVSAGTWSVAPSSIAYQWYAGGVAVPGATSTTFVPDATQIGKKLRVWATAKLSGYTATQTGSNRTVAVVPGTLAPTAPPSVSGTAAVGSPLTVSAAWTATPTEVDYQWYADGVAVPGATTATLVPDAAMIGKRLRVWLTAARPGYTSTQTASPRTPATVPGTIAVTRAARVTGRPHLGRLLTLDPGVYATTGVTWSVQWLRAGVAVPGATASTYRTSAADLGSTVSARITSSSPGYTTRTVTTARTRHVRSAPSMRVRTHTSHGRMRVSVRVSALDVAQVDGTIRIRSRGVVLARVTLRHGRATTVVTGLSAGRRPVGIRYSGSATVLTDHVRRTVRIG